MCQRLDELIKSRSLHLHQIAIWTSICKYYTAKVDLNMNPACSARLCMNGAGAGVCFPPLRQRPCPEESTLFVDLSVRRSRVEHSFFMGIGRKWFFAYNSGTRRSPEPKLRILVGLLGPVRTRLATTSGTVRFRSYGGAKSKLWEPVARPSEGLSTRARWRWIGGNFKFNFVSNSFPTDSAKPVPLAVVSLDSR